MFWHCTKCLEINAFNCDITGKQSAYRVDLQHTIYSYRFRKTRFNVLMACLCDILHNGHTRDYPENKGKINY